MDVYSCVRCVCIFVRRETGEMGGGGGMQKRNEEGDSDSDR